MTIKLFAAIRYRIFFAIIDKDQIKIRGQGHFFCPKSSHGHDGKAGLFNLTKTSADLLHHKRQGGTHNSIGNGGIIPPCTGAINHALQQLRADLKFPFTALPPQQAQSIFVKFHLCNSVL